MHTFQYAHGAHMNIHDTACINDEVSSSVSNLLQFHIDIYKSVHVQILPLNWLIDLLRGLREHL